MDAPTISGKYILKSIFPARFLNWLYNPRFAPVRLRHFVYAMDDFMDHVMDGVDSKQIKISSYGKYFACHYFDRESFYIWFNASGIRDWLNEFDWPSDYNFQISNAIEKEQRFKEIKELCDGFNHILDSHKEGKIDIEQIKNSILKLSQGQKIIGNKIQSMLEIIIPLKNIKPDLIVTIQSALHDLPKSSPASKSQLKGRPPFEPSLKFIKTAIELYRQGVKKKDIPRHKSIIKIIASKADHMGMSVSNKQYLKEYKRGYRTIYDNAVKFINAHSFPDKNE